MEESPYLRRLHAVRERFPETDGEGYDTAWIIRPENRRYLSGFTAGDLQFTELSGSLLINRTGAVLATDSRYLLQAEGEARDFQAKLLGTDLAEGISALAREMGATALGFEEDYLTWGLHGRLGEKLAVSSPAVDLVPMNGLVEEMRQVKDRDEVRAIQAAADLISDIFEEIVPSLKPGMTEMEVARKIETLARDGGADGLSFPSIVASGPNAALPHAVPTDRGIGKNEPVIIDAGVRLKGYCSDMTRTVFMGNPEGDLRDVYRTVRLAQSTAMGEIRPGVETARLDSVAREIIKEAGFGEYFGHGLGHGVGLAVHELPRVGPGNSVKLRQGMVFTVEPGIYIPGRGGVRVEDMVLVEEGGPRVLTRDAWKYDF